MSEIQPTPSKRKVGRPRKSIILEETPQKESICTVNPIDIPLRRTNRISIQVKKENNIQSEDGVSQEDTIESPSKINVAPKGKRGRKPGVSYKKLLLALSCTEDDALVEKPFSTDVMELLEFKVKILEKVDCPICSTYNCTSMSQIIQHMLTCKHEPILCKLCGGKYENLEAKVEHLISSHNGIEYEIDPKAIDLHRSFVSKSLGKYKTFHCFKPSCHKAYTTIPGLMYHLKACFPPDLPKQTPRAEPIAATPTFGPPTVLGSARASKVKAKQNLSSYIREDGSESPEKIKEEIIDADFMADLEDEYIEEDFHMKERSTPTKKPLNRLRKSVGKQEYLGPILYSPTVLPDWKPDLNKWYPAKVDSSISRATSSNFYVVDPNLDIFDIEKNEITLAHPVAPTTLRFGQSKRQHGGHSITGYAGGCVTALSWSPFTLNDMQYFCLCARLDNDIGTIQVWGTIDPFVKNSNAENHENNDGMGADQNIEGAVPCFQYGIVHQFGTVYDAKFCPTLQKSEPIRQEKWDFLGYLAFTTSVGPVVIIPLPLPRDLAQASDQNVESKWFETTNFYYLSLYPPALKDLKKVDEIEIAKRVMVKSAVFPQCLDWHLGPESCKLAAGFTDGSIGIWNLTTSSSSASACWDLIGLMPRGEALTEISSIILDDLGDPDPNVVEVAALRPTRLLPAGIGHLREVTGVAWCPFDRAGRYLAAVGRDKSHAIWDTLEPNGYGCSGLQPLPHTRTKTATHFTGCAWSLDTVNILAIGDTHASSQSFRVFDNGFALTEPTKLGTVHHSCHLDICIDPYDSTFAISTAGGMVLAYQDFLNNFTSKSRAHRHLPIYQITSTLRPLEDGSTQNMVSDGGDATKTEPSRVVSFKIRLFDDQLYHEEIRGNAEPTILTQDKDLQTAPPPPSPYLLFNDVYQNVSEAKTVAVLQRFQEKLKTTCFENPFYKDQLYIYKVAWNPLACSHNWLLSGTGSGFFRLNHLPNLGDTFKFYDKASQGGSKKRKL